MIICRYDTTFLSLRGLLYHHVPVKPLIEWETTNLSWKMLPVGVS
jgi:hypothetical protein